ncbi:MAG: SCP2 sterol-binding domain-containing protein [Acidimicrobiia bacterium]|nr:SCP2 sterol-binding domain-containing protein [Acidimicrobiia bacterium]
MSSVYGDADTFIGLFTRLFDDITTSQADQLDDLVKRKMVICFDVHDPEVQMWVDGRHSPVRTSFGAESTKATLTAMLSGDALHELLLGTLPLGRALTSGRLKVKGSKLKAMRLESLLHACQAAYPELADEMLDG